MKILNFKYLVPLFQLLISVGSAGRFILTPHNAAMCTEKLHFKADHQECEDACVRLTGCRDYFWDKPDKCYVCVPYTSEYCGVCVPIKKHYMQAECLVSKFHIFSTYMYKHTNIANGKTHKIKVQFSKFHSGEIELNWHGIRVYNSDKWHIISYQQKVNGKLQRFGVGEYTTTTVEPYDRLSVLFRFLGENTNILNHKGLLTESTVVVRCGVSKLRNQNFNKNITRINLFITEWEMCGVTPHALFEHACTFINYCKFFNAEKKWIYDFSFLKDTVYDFEHKLYRFRFSFCKPVECLDHRNTLLCQFVSLKVTSLAYMGTAILDFDDVKDVSIHMWANGEKIIITLKCAWTLHVGHFFVHPYYRDMHHFIYRGSQSCKNIYKK